MPITDISYIKSNDLLKLNEELEILESEISEHNESITNIFSGVLTLKWPDIANTLGYRLKIINLMEDVNISGINTNLQNICNAKVSGLKVINNSFDVGIKDQSFVEGSMDPISQSIVSADIDIKMNDKLLIYIKSLGDNINSSYSYAIPYDINNIPISNREGYTINELIHLRKQYLSAISHREAKSITDSVNKLVSKVKVSYEDILGRDQVKQILDYRTKEKIPGTDPNSM